MYIFHIGCIFLFLHIFRYSHLKEIFFTVIRVVRAMLKGVDDAEIEKIVLNISGMSIKDNDTKRRGRSARAAAPVTIMEAKGSKLITILEKMVDYECLAEVKKKSAMVSFKGILHGYSIMIYNNFRIVKMLKSNGSKRKITGSWSL